MGFIYVLTSDICKSDHYKIGYTTKSLHELRQQYTRALCNPNILYYAEFENHKKAEKYIHKYFDKYRINKCEWFVIKQKSLITRAINECRNLLSNKSYELDNIECGNYITNNTESYNKSYVFDDVIWNDYETCDIVCNEFENYTDNKYEPFDNIVWNLSEKYYKVEDNKNNLDKYLNEKDMMNRDSNKKFYISNEQEKDKNALMIRDIKYEDKGSIKLLDSIKKYNSICVIKDLDNEEMYKIYATNVAINNYKLKEMRKNIVYCENFFNINKALAFIYNVLNKYRIHKTEWFVLKSLDILTNSLNFYREFEFDSEMDKNKDDIINYSYIIRSVEHMSVEDKKRLIVTMFDKPTIIEILKEQKKIGIPKYKKADILDNISDKLLDILKNEAKMLIEENILYIASKYSTKMDDSVDIDKQISLAKIELNDYINYISQSYNITYLYDNIECLIFSNIDIQNIK